MDQNQNYGAESPIAAEKPAGAPPTREAVKAMIFGIISADISLVPFLGIVGLIFGILARKWALPIIEDYPYTKERLFAKTGYITGGVGRGLFIGFTIFWVIYFGFFGLMALLSMLA